MEEWYDENPEATFGKIEQQARKLRREMMGPGLETLINGRDTDLRVEAPPLCAMWARDGVSRMP